MSQYLIATNVLEAIVRGSLADMETLRVHSSLPLVGGKPIEVAVEGEECRVSVQLDARFGEFIPGLGAAARRRIAQALHSITGLKVAAVDIIISGVFAAAT